MSLTCTEPELTELSNENKGTEQETMKEAGHD